MEWIYHPLKVQALMMSRVVFSDAVSAIRSLGQNTLLEKVDIKSAYRMIPVHLDDRLLLCRVYVNGALSFGLRLASRIFTAVADVLEWRARIKGIEYILHYLDNFLIIATPGSSQCGQNLAGLLALFDKCKYQ